jgi:hypothetical protein
MATTLERVARDIRERADQLRAELAEREREYREATGPMREELARLDGALRAMEDPPDAGRR